MQLTPVGPIIIIVVTARRTSSTVVPSLPLPQRLFAMINTLGDSSNQDDDNYDKDDNNEDNKDNNNYAWAIGVGKRGL
jgi:hypothetical protein